MNFFSKPHTSQTEFAQQEPWLEDQPSTNPRLKWWLLAAGVILVSSLLLSLAILMAVPEPNQPESPATPPTTNLKPSMPTSQLLQEWQAVNAILQQADPNRDMLPLPAVEVEFPIPDFEVAR